MEFNDVNFLRPHFLCNRSGKKLFIITIGDEKAKFQSAKRSDIQKKVTTSGRHTIFLSKMQMTDFRLRQNL